MIEALGIKKMSARLIFLRNVTSKENVRSANNKTNGATVISTICLGQFIGSRKDVNTKPDANEISSVDLSK
jgi:hypothetical protein